MTGLAQAWQCIGSGKIEVPQTRIGVGQNRKVSFVYAFEHKEILAQLKFAHRLAVTLETLARKLAHTTPHEGEWERSSRTLQNQARQVLAAHAGDAPDLEEPAPVTES